MGLLDVTPYTNIKTWQLFSNEIGASYISAHLGQPPRIRYEYKKWNFEFDKYKKGGGKSILEYTRLRTVIKTHENIEFKLSDSLSNTIWNLFSPKRNQYKYNGFDIMGENDSIIRALLDLKELYDFLRIRNEVELYISKRGVTNSTSNEYSLCLNRLGEWKDTTELNIWLHIMQAIIEHLVDQEFIVDSRVEGSLV